MLDLSISPIVLWYQSYVAILQRWFVSGDIVCFAGAHAPLALLAIILLLFCILLIPLVVAIALGKIPKVSKSKILIMTSIKISCAIFLNSYPILQCIL